MILSDTVGFISDLPTQLVAAFRATLEEVLEADLIVHVRDISHPDSAAQAEDVAAILADLGVSSEVPQLELWNKIDMVAGEARAELQAIADRREEVFALSALTGEGIDTVLEAMGQALAPPRFAEVLDLPYAEGRKRAWLYEEGVIEAEEAGEDGYRISVNWTARQKQAFGAL